MNPRDFWQPLSIRIRSLVTTSQFSAALFRNSAEAAAATKALAAHVGAIKADLLQFANALPKGTSTQDSNEYARQAIRRVSNTVSPLLDSDNSTGDTRSINIRTSLVLIAALEGEVSYILRDSQETVRSRTDRAFAHLSRSIMVDHDLRAKWVVAYENGEPACEKLGAIHLLSHGVWAFKAGRMGGETDLVYEEPLTDISGIERMSDGLVLTEWKKHSGSANPGNLFLDARKQAALYKSGVLGGTELTKYRYVIVVSVMEIPVPEDFVTNDCVYRHINIAIAPRAPSKH